METIYPRRVEDYISVKPLASLAVKGKRHPVKVCEVLDIKNANSSKEGVISDGN